MSNPKRVSLSTLANPLLLVLLVVAFFGTSEAIIGKWDTTTSSRRVTIEWFTFLDDGTYHIEVEPSKRGVPLVLLICRETKWLGVDYNSDDSADHCRRVNAGQAIEDCSWVKFKGYLNYTHRTSYNSLYKFDVLNCNRTKLNLKFYYELVNPDGEQLGWSHYILPYLYAVLLFLYFILFLVLCANIILTHWGSGSNRLHKLICIWPVMKLFILSFDLGFWEFISDEGVTSWLTTTVYAVINALWSCYVLAVVVLVAFGWGVVRKTLTWIEIIFASVLVSCHYIAMLVNFGFAWVFVVPSIISFIGIGILVCFGVFMTIREMTDLVSGPTQSQSSRNAGPQPRHPHLHQRATTPRLTAGFERSRPNLEDQLKMLKRIRFILPTYVFCMALNALLFVVFFLQLEWLYRLANEISEILIFLTILFVFRLRKKNIYFDFNDSFLDINGGGVGGPPSSRHGDPSIGAELALPSSSRASIGEDEDDVELNPMTHSVHSRVSSTNDYEDDDDDDTEFSYMPPAPPVRVTPGPPPGTFVPTAQIISFESDPHFSGSGTGGSGSGRGQAQGYTQASYTAGTASGAASTPSSAMTSTRPSIGITVTAPTAGQARQQDSSDEEDQEDSERQGLQSTSSSTNDPLGTRKRLTVTTEEVTVGRVKGQRGIGPPTLRKPRDFEYDETQGYWASKQADDVTPAKGAIELQKDKPTEE